MSGRGEDSVRGVVAPSAVRGGLRLSEVQRQPGGGEQRHGVRGGGRRVAGVPPGRWEVPAEHGLQGIMVELQQRMHADVDGDYDAEREGRGVSGSG